MKNSILIERKDKTCKCKASILTNHIRKLSKQILAGNQFKKILLLTN